MLDARAAVETRVPSSATPVLVAHTNSSPAASNPISLNISGDAALIPQSGPGGTVTDVDNMPPPDRISVYVVRPGDTLSDIAGMFGVSINTIIWANNLSNARDVRPGQTLVILPISGIEKTIAKGDTLASIAKKHNADADEIAQYNGLDPAEPLALGSIIIIPGGEFPSIPSSPKNSVPRSVTKPYRGGSGSAYPGYYTNPVPGGTLTQGLHGWNGVDIGAARGTPIRAAADGTVIIARNNGGWNGGYGNYAVLMHENGSQTLYSHMKNTIISAGQSVSSGQIIGYVGSTGLSTGPHLHLEFRGAANPFRNCTVGTACSPE